MTRFVPGLLTTAMLAGFGLAGGGCSSSSSGTDLRADVPGDTSGDVTLDAADMGPDLAMDMGTDTAMDMGTDTAMDVGTDTAMDMGTDTAMDTGNPGPFTLTFSGTQFTPHNGQDFLVAVVDAGTGVVVASDATTISDGVFSFTFTGVLVKGTAYHLDYYADFNSNGSCDAPPTDHAWRTEITAVTADVDVQVVHNTDFTDVCASFAS